MRGLGGIEEEELGNSDGGADAACRRRDVPSDVVVRRPDGEAGFAFCFDARDEGEDEALAVYVAEVFGVGEQGARDGAGGVDDGFEVRVVVVVDVAGDAVDEGGVLGVCFKLAMVAEEGGCRLAEEGLEGLVSDLGRRVIAAADGAAGPVVEAAGCCLGDV